VRVVEPARSNMLEYPHGPTRWRCLIGAARDLQVQRDSIGRQTQSTPHIHLCYLDGRQTALIDFRTSYNSTGVSRPR
jgi:hypothetical protein